MNNIARRIIAGVSAAALFVSAVGSDAFIGIFGREIYAVSATGTGKLGKSTGFSNLEQDTYYDTAGNLYYNTGYGLHTNKTASVAKDSTDGRTFDVNLESWYVGENPVDVATILDASGSMAWTVDTLEPLIVSDQLDTADENYLIDKYKTTDLAEIQDNNGGYLPQDVVDLILDKTKTDNSKLSYSDYLYYIYEARSSVSEFVPLGYWDGYTGKISRDEDESLIGYYNFDESDKWKNLKSTTGGRMEEVVSGTGYPSPSGNNSYSGVGSAIEIGKKRYYASATDIKPDYRGVKLDISPTDAFTISFAMKRKNDINDWQVFKVGNSEKYFYIKSPDRNNAITVRNQDGNGGTSGTANLIGTEYAFFTFVFYKSSEGNVIYNLYKDGSIDQKGTTSGSAWNDIFNSGEKIDIIFDPCDQDAQGKKNLYIDDIYVFDKALTEEEVANYFGEGGEGDLCESTTYDKGKVKTAVYHAKTVDGVEALDIAQITDSLYNNPNADERAGWYYVNSHSNWADISGCLESGKQYLGLRYDEYLGKVPTNPSDVGGDDTKEKIDETVKAEDIAKDRQSYANVPSAWQASIDENGDKSEYYEVYKKLQDGDSTKEFTPSENERSIQFYVDSQGFLRCFYCTGDLSWKKSDNTWKYSPRTFCSLVYEKKQYKEEVQSDGTIQRTGNATKYEELNFALNQFYQELAEGSDLSNSAIVRFSTHNLIDKNSKDDSVFQSLIMQNWTNYSDEFRDSKNTLTRKQYLQDLLIPEKGETSVPDSGSTEYPYTMTGGTYTWTGLKAFYDNLVNPKTTGDTVYNIANDARDKYLIIFTDGRDNTIDTTGTDYVANNKPDMEDAGVTEENQLAKAWADKLKEEGYTIYCVMMATGSISPTANESEYNRALDFLQTLAGNTEIDEEIADLKAQLETLEADPSSDPKKVEELKDQIDELENDKVIIADPSKEENAILNAFQDILAQIQQPRQDYTVQDYIDPRFDLIDKDDNVYHLGAGGKITVKNTDGTTNEVTVGNIIDHIDDETSVKTLAYTPRDSYMVNRKADSTSPDGYTTGDGVGTGYLYYDDEKDMYYLRWTDQIIPMENKAFDTDTSDPDTYLDVWSATIRLKAKDDFIGGNYILTNGNEAGENLVYSDATIENMDKGDNYKLYGFEEKDKEGGDKIPYRQKLEALSGTNRKINAVDAGGVSQAVYGNGIDIPSSGFPRVTVNVRLLKLDAKDLSDVIYMGEVVSPTMMLADLENDYMTGSYYLEYLERYAYRLYGYGAAETPLLELLNQWLKINEKDYTEKKFTIPYMYLPDPIYTKEGKLETDDDKVKVNNNTGMSTIVDSVSGFKIADFNDPNLRDVTGFITYTWERADENEEKQQEITVDGETRQDITKEYVVKNTNQIKYNLKLMFTPLKYTAKELEGFTLDKNFIQAIGGKGAEKFFYIDDGEFKEMTTELAWTTDYGRKDYLQAMISETKTYEPHVMYDNSEGKKKWVLVDDSSTDGFTSENAVKAYVDADKTEQTKDVDGKPKEVTDSGVYDWDKAYKPVPEDDKEQIEKVNIKGYYTDTPENVKLVDKDGNNITDDTGTMTPGREPCSLVANTTYVKDVVNAALALELVVDGKYLQEGSPIRTAGKTYTFIATRYYDDPFDPLPYAPDTELSADTGKTDSETGKVEGKKYQLTFTVDETSLPEKPQPNQIYTVWAKLTKVEVEDSSSSGYAEIKGGDAEANPYLGYEKVDALPIGTYVISTEESGNELNNGQFKIGTEGEGATPTDVHFAYLKTDNTSASYTYNRFPDSVYDVSPDAAKDTGDGEYLIKKGATDNSSKNIAENVREVTGAPDENQKLTFYFGTDKSTNSKGSDKDESIYTKDRLGIIILSKNNNSLSISKEVTHVNETEKDFAYTHEWEFTVRFKPDNVTEFETTNTSKGFALTWYNFDDTDGEWKEDSDPSYDTTLKFTLTPGSSPPVYTATLVLKHNEKVKINDLSDGKWQVEEIDETATTFYFVRNDMDTVDEQTWSNKTDELDLKPDSCVAFENEFPYNLPSAGGIGTNILIYSGITFMLLSGLSFAILYKRGRSRDKPKG